MSSDYVNICFVIWNLVVVLTMKTGDYNDDLEDSLQIDEPSDVNNAKVSVNTECPAPLSEDTGGNVLNEEQKESKAEESETKNTLSGDGFHNVTLNVEDFQVSPTRCYKHHVEHWFAVFGPNGLEKAEQVVEKSDQKPTKSTILIKNQQNNNKDGKMKLFKKTNVRKKNRAKFTANSEQIPKDSLAYLPDVSYGQHLSILSKRQHQIYIAMHVTYSLKNRFNFKNDKTNLNNVKASLAEEYVKFNEFVRNHTLSNVKDRYSKLPFAILKYTTDCILNRILRTCELIPEWFENAGSLKKDSSNDHAFMEFKQLLLKTGSVFEFHKPDLHRQAGIRFGDFESVAEKYPPTERSTKVHHSSRGCQFEKCVFIHKDPNVRRLLKKYPANVVSTMSTIRALLTGSGWLCCQNFDIPIRIELLNDINNANGEKMKVLFALKPICSDYVTAPNARRLAAKYACKAFILRTLVTDIDMSYCNIGFFVFGVDGFFGLATLGLLALGFLEVAVAAVAFTFFGLAAALVFFADAAAALVDEADLGFLGFFAFTFVLADDAPAVCFFVDFFTVFLTVVLAFLGFFTTAGLVSPTRKRPDAPVPLASLIAPDFKPQSEDLPSSSSSSSNPNLPSTSGNKSNEEKAAKKGAKKPKLNDIFSEMLQNVPGFGVACNKKPKKHQEIPAELPSNYVEPETAGTQWHYNLWKLGSLNLIIRSNNDAVFKQPSDQSEMLRRVDISFAPKVEFQPCHGAEKLSIEELQYHYWTSWLKRTKQHFIPRVHYATGDILGVEKCSSDDLLRRISRDGFYDEGWYILRYNSKRSSMRILKQTDNPDESSMKSEEIFDMQRPKSEWISEVRPEFAIAEIDPEVILQWHIIKKRIPCTFPPRANSTEKKERTKNMDDDVKWTELRSAAAHLRDRRTRHIAELMEMGTFKRNIEFLQEQRGLVGALVERTKQQLDRLNVELTDELDNFQQSAEQFAIEHSPFFPFVEEGKIYHENHLLEHEFVQVESYERKLWFDHLQAREHKARAEIAQLQQSIQIAENNLSEKRCLLSREMIILNELRLTYDRVERSSRVQVKHLKLALQTLRGQSSAKRKRLQTLQNQLEAVCSGMSGCLHGRGSVGRGIIPTSPNRRSMSTTTTTTTSTLFLHSRSGNFHQFQYHPKICINKQQQQQLDAEFFPSLNTIRQSVDNDEDDDDDYDNDDAYYDEDEEDKENNDQYY
ncbi:NMDA receptor-regulated protein 2 [Trichinella nelsoni]|uniref:NMDA receptor-regulated protein 2 n=1 Tax=Trichinella nelsoni TaxID=6336 RepID=A0A0V0RIE1_9BILA|nr:NMDA receptor-regulated protein 2 [Trichinella nelsoni]